MVCREVKVYLAQTVIGADDLQLLLTRQIAEI